MPCTIPQKGLVTPAIPDEWNTINSKISNPLSSIIDNENLQSDSFKDREQRAVAALLARYKNLVTLAAMPAGDGATKEIAAAHAFQMEVESNALVRSYQQAQELY
jgi:hypothetical protein